MEHRIKIFFFLDQKDFGDKCNCSLTSITSICYTRFRNPSEKEIYNIVESIGKKYYYNDKRGTNPLLIKNIFNKSLEYFSKQKCQTHSNYLKEFGYNFTTIKNLIDMNKPVILSFWKCEKYSNHTITVIGYDDETQDLIIADNWSKRPQKINYKNISTISSINYF